MATIHSTPDLQQHRWQLDFNSSLTFELPVELCWFTASQLNDACDAVEVKLGTSKVTVLPPGHDGKRFEIIAEQDGITIDLGHVKQAFLKALGINAIIRRVNRGFYACDCCLDTKAPLLYMFTIGMGDRLCLCPQGARHRIDDHRATPSSIVEILEVI